MTLFLMEWSVILELLAMGYLYISRGSSSSRNNNYSVQYSSRSGHPTFFRRCGDARIFYHEMLSLFRSIFALYFPKLNLVFNFALSFLFFFSDNCIYHSFFLLFLLIMNTLLWVLFNYPTYIHYYYRFYGVSFVLDVIICCWFQLK